MAAVMLTPAIPGRRLLRSEVVGFGAVCGLSVAVVMAAMLLLMRYRRSETRPECGGRSPPAPMVPAWRRTEADQPRVKRGGCSGAASPCKQGQGPGWDVGHRRRLNRPMRALDGNEALRPAGGEGRW
jgi:hypothetical protein